METHKDWAIDEYFKCKIFGVHPGKRLARTQDPDIQEGVLDIIFKVGYEQDLELQKALSGVKFKK